MNDLSKKTFLWGIVGLVIFRILMVLLLMNNVPWTDMQANGFRPNFGGSYWPDELHYFQLGQSLAKFSPTANVANLGYPLFLAPIIYLTGASGPADIVKPVFIIQAFLFFGLAIVLVALTACEIFSAISGSTFGGKKRKLALLAASLFTLYPYLLFFALKAANFPRAIPAFHYQMWIVTGADYLSAILLYSGFYLFYKKVQFKPAYPELCGYNWYYNESGGSCSRGEYFVLAADFFDFPVKRSPSTARPKGPLGAQARTRFLTGLKKYNQSLIFSASAFLAYLPQWIYNFYFFGSPFTYGYRIQELSGHGLETKIIGGWLSFSNVSIFFERVWMHFPLLIWILPVIIFILALGFWKIFRQQALLAFILGFWAVLNIGFYIFFVDAQSQLRYFIPSILPLLILFLTGAIKIYEYRRIL